MHHSHVRSGKDSLLHLRYGRDDICVCSTAAEIAAHALADLIVVERHMISVQIGAHCTRPALLGLAQHPNGRADLSRRAVAALECIVRNERPLERVQVLTVCQPFDRHDQGVLMRDREREAAVHAPAIEQDSTGAALPMIAAFLGTSKPETFAQRIQECRPGIDGKLMYSSVHPQSDLNIHSSCVSLLTPTYKRGIRETGRCK